MCYSDDGLTLLAALGVGDVAVLDLRMVRTDQHSIYLLLFSSLLFYLILFYLILIRSLFLLSLFLFFFLKSLIILLIIMLFFFSLRYSLLTCLTCLDPPPTYLFLFLNLMGNTTNSYCYLNRTNQLDDDISQLDAFMMVILSRRYICITQQRMIH